MNGKPRHAERCRMKVFQYVTPDREFELIWEVETGKLTLNVQHGGVSIVLPDDARIGLSKALWYSCTKPAS